MLWCEVYYIVNGFETIRLHVYPCLAAPAITVPRDIASTFHIATTCNLFELQEGSLSGWAPSLPICLEHFPQL
jgi:hypothetical protein